MRDLIAGVVVGIVALPLALAFAIASGVPPERGLYTAVIAGFLISALGGSRVQPFYPKLALTARMNGTVIVECIIDKTGRVREAHVVRSTSTLFDQTAVDAVQQWQFAPGSLHGQAIDTIFDLTVTFRVSS